MARNHTREGHVRPLSWLISLVAASVGPLSANLISQMVGVGHSAPTLWRMWLSASVFSSGSTAAGERCRVYSTLPSPPQFFACKVSTFAQFELSGANLREWWLTHGCTCRIPTTSLAITRLCSDCSLILLRACP